MKTSVTNIFKVLISVIADYNTAMFLPIRVSIKIFTLLTTRYFSPYLCIYALVFSENQFLWDEVKLTRGLHYFL